MKTQITQLIEKALQDLQAKDILPRDFSWPKVHVENARGVDHGDFSTNIALVLGKAIKQPPLTLANAIQSTISPPHTVEKIEVAPPGFINFFIKSTAFYSVIQTILEQKGRYGTSHKGEKKRVLLEFVSANPTGPLHVGHGRGAALGASLANLLEAVGFSVHREYYINDAGRQMDILATSIWLRYLELCSFVFPFPQNAYRGSYVIDMARTLLAQQKQNLVREKAEVFKNVPPDEEDKEAHIDALICNAKALLGKDYSLPHQLGLDTLLSDIKEDLSEFNVYFDNWFSEKSLQQQGVFLHVVERLQQHGYLYEQDGALWFKSSLLGDEKDRVIRKENGEYTYFATDIAYHLNKAERGFNKLIDILGADHHGYVPRISASLQALGYPKEMLTVLLVQFAILYRGKERIQMSSRSGSFVTLRELRKEVGNDAARFFYVLRRCEQHLDFDLELAKSTSTENPVYYIQYAYARVCSVGKKLHEQGLAFDSEIALPHLSLLQEDAEEKILQTLARYPEVVEASAFLYQPHLMAHYLQELAGHFHAYYNAHKVLEEDPSLRNARLALSFAVRQVIYNGLTLLGVSTPEVM